LTSESDRFCYDRAGDVGASPAYFVCSSHTDHNPDAGSLASLADLHVYAKERVTGTTWARQGAGDVTPICPRNIKIASGFTGPILIDRLFSRLADIGAIHPASG